LSGIEHPRTQYLNAFLLY